MDASIVCIGDELLTGDTVNTNAAWLAARLSRRGVNVLRILVLPDDVEQVAQELRKVPGDVVLVTGGLGPTPDDVTREAVARASDMPLTESAEALASLEAKRVPAGPARAMARIPRGGEVLANPVGEAPGFAVGGRIYVLPGVPSEMQAMFAAVEGRFAGQQERVEVVETRIPESHIAHVIGELVRRFSDVKVGSYPGADRVRIRMRSADPAALAAARAWLEGRLLECDSAIARGGHPGLRLLGEPPSPGGPSTGGGGSR